MPPKQPISERFTSVVTYLQSDLLQVPCPPGSLHEGCPQFLARGYALQHEWGCRLPRGQDAGEFCAGTQPPVTVVHTDATPVPFGRAFVLVQAGEDKTVRPGWPNNDLRVL